MEVAAQSNACSPQSPIMAAMTAPHKRPAAAATPGKGKDVQRMFASIAPRYDLLNRLLSFGVDRFWRELATRAALQGHPRRLLDVATGTGDFALKIKRQSPSTLITGSDFVPQMLDLARRKAKAAHLSIRFEEADALSLPYPDSSFDAVTCAFGFRNFADYRAGLSEFARVLGSGGRLVILEFPPPSRGPFGQLFRLYFRQILPRIGGLVSGNADAYAYLPESVLAFPEPEELLTMLRQSGFEARYQPLTGGIAGLWVANKR